MKTSESINELAAALSKAQGEMTGAKKGSDNPFFKSKYSDLSQVTEAISKPFANNGLSFAQGAEFDDGRVAVTTRIMHSSGQWIEATTCLPPTKNDAQGYGSAITYAKRYGLQALAGVPSVDDDGNEAVKHATGEPAQHHSFSAKQKHYFDGLLEKGDALALYCLKETLVDGDGSSSGASIWLDLCGSFPKGEKGKKADLIRELVNAGKVKFDEVSDLLDDYASKDDPAGIEEVMSELSELEKKIVIKKLNPQTAEILQAA